MQTVEYSRPFYDIIFPTRKDAEQVLCYMHEILETYGEVTVADLYDLAGVNGTYQDSKRRWYNLDNAQVLRVKEGYVLTLPKPSEKLSYKRYFYLSANRSSNRKESTNEMYESKDAMVSHPSHYQSEAGLEVIDVIEAFTSDLTGIEATDTGNILKYMCRWKKKNGLQDLEKAKWYLQHLIDHVKQVD